jgi:hypothetical protein
MSVQNKCKRYLLMMRLKMDLLNKYWDIELSKMIMRFVKQKQKTKKQKEFLHKLRDIKDSIKLAILRIYLDKCKT